MAVTTEELVPVLEDARQAHAAVLDRFRADVAVTPPGPYRQMLEHHTDEVQESVDLIQHQVRRLQQRGIIGSATAAARFVARGAAGTAMLPLRVGSKIVTGMLYGKGPADARQLLRNTEDEYATAARALAASRAGEALASHVDDQAAADALGAVRRQDEELLQALEQSLTEHARAMARPANGSRPDRAGGGSVADAAAQTMRAAAERARDLTRRGGRQAGGAAEGALRETAQPDRMAEEVQGAVTREDELPIAGFSQLSTGKIQQRLRTLSQSELTVIEGYERAHAQRKGVLEAIEQLRGSEPWDGYDVMGPAEITARLADAPVGVARQVMEYERRHRQRQDVISAAETRIPGS
ncbi:hypothetical protein [Streptomyces lomondensis]|uniref:DUF222 domain-containing protein n=1 Tax=Streptomyces lomondensis TaxID=68229 RepID=A0ABQ2X9V0_9ACTN|nr:hypothetical protein [Streptomyces lomondensis]MCF0077136.1 hypothetical protein [Streptomyces lomondensis]GGX06447.1 hypothetical protein GCM10010383_40590 [Streptomyces lomondensis]